MKRLGSDLSSAQKEMRTKHKAYENAVGILSRRLQEALTAQELAEAELSQLRAGAAEGGGDLTLRVGTCVCCHILRDSLWGRDVLHHFPRNLHKAVLKRGGTRVWPCLSCMWVLWLTP